MAKRQPPVVIPPGLFKPPDMRASFVQADLWIVRARPAEKPYVVRLSEPRCYLHGTAECVHVKIARAEHQRLFAIYGEDIPDSETVLLDAMKAAYDAIPRPAVSSPTVEEGGAA